MSDPFFTMFPDGFGRRKKPSGLETLQELLDQERVNRIKQQLIYGEARPKVSWGDPEPCYTELCRSLASSEFAQITELEKLLTRK